MYDSCGHKMTKIIGFKIQPAGKSILLILANVNANHRIILVMGINALIKFLNNDRGVDIAVRTLGTGDHANHLVHELIQFFIFGDSIDSSTSLQPLIEIAVMKRRTLMFPFHITGRNFKITEPVRYIR